MALKSHHAHLCCDNLQELTDLRNRVESRATKSQGRGQGFAARLAASGTSLKSDNSSGPSSPATPSDERPKGRSDVFTRLGPMPAPTSQAPSYQVGCQHLLGQQLLC